MQPTIGLRNSSDNKTWEPVLTLRMYAMKKIFIVLLFCVLGGYVSAQVTVRGMAIRSNLTDTLKGVLVNIYPDTTNPPPFTPKFTFTDSLGRYIMSLPTMPLNTKFYVSTLNCDSVTQKVNTITYTGNNNIVSDLIVCVTPTVSFNGYVYLGTSAKRPVMNEGIVYVLKKCPGNIVTYVDTVLTDTNGYFKIDSFPTLTSGCEVIMKAVLKTGSGDYKKFFPAYHNGNANYSLRWSDAVSIPLSVAKGGVNILMPAAVNPTGGPSAISGYAIDAASGNRIDGKVLFLTDMNDVPVDFVYTDGSGTFSISNLPFGTYKLFGDVLGKANPELVIKVDADHVNQGSVVFRDYADRFEGSIGTSVTGSGDAQMPLTLYPNPAHDIVFVQGAEYIKGDKSVELYDLAGRVVYSTVVADGNDVSIPLSGIAKGIYHLRLTCAGTKVNFRLVK